MHLFIKTLMGNHWRLDGLHHETPVEALKLLVYRKTGMHPDVQRLYWKNREITSLLTLSDGCTLQLHPQMQTGF